MRRNSSPATRRSRRSWSASTPPSTPSPGRSTCSKRAARRSLHLPASRVPLFQHRDLDDPPGRDMIDSGQATGSTRHVTPVPCQKLYPAVLMMTSAKNRVSSELTEPLDRPMARRILFQGQMGSQSVVIAGEGRRDPAQMGLANNDDVIQAFSADRGRSVPLRMPVLPGSASRSPVVLHGS